MERKLELKSVINIFLNSLFCVGGYKSNEPLFIFISMFLPINLQLTWYSDFGGICASSASHPSSASHVAWTRHTPSPATPAAGSVPYVEWALRSQWTRSGKPVHPIHWVDHFPRWNLICPSCRTRRSSLVDDLNRASLCSILCNFMRKCVVWKTRARRRKLM